MPLTLSLDVCSLTMSLVNIGSASGAEAVLADAIEQALRPLEHLQVARVGDTVVARTDEGYSERVVVAGHLDTAASDRAPLAYIELGELRGLGTSDAKGALAVMLRAAATGGYNRDVSFVFYAGGRSPDGPDGLDTELRQADFALLAEPTGSVVRGGALGHPSAEQLISLTGVDPISDPGDAHGLTHVASLGIPAVAFGPGDPDVAGSADEAVATAQLARCEYVLRQWLTR